MDPVTINGLNITGRVSERPPELGNTYATFNANFSTAANYQVQFGVQSQGQTFGILRSMFVDNGSNPSEVEVAISGTDHFFTIPAYSIGTYTVDASAGSTVSLITDGGASDICTIVFYNWERPPVVWYSFGAFNSDKPVKAYGTMQPGDTVAAVDFNEPLFFGGIDGTGVFRAIRTDALGRLDFTGANITIGGVYGADPMGGAPVNPGLVQAVLNNAGNISYVQLNANSEFKVHDTDVLAKTTDVETQLVAVNVNLTDIEGKLTGPAGSTTTSVAAAIVDTVILAANANRKGGLIYNASTAIMYLLFEAVGSSAVVYSTQIDAGGSFVIGDYTGPLCATWTAANGSAKVSEFV